MGSHFMSVEDFKKLNERLNSLQEENSKLKLEILSLLEENMLMEKEIKDLRLVTVVEKPVEETQNPLVKSKTSSRKKGN